jgi:hypothetical protein
MREKEISIVPKLARFENGLMELINRNGIESECNIPDFILAKLICNFILAIGIATKEVLAWRGCDSACHPKRKIEKETKKMIEICESVSNCRCVSDLENEIARLKLELEKYQEALIKTINKACLCGDKLDSNGRSSYADAMRLLERDGKIEILWGCDRRLVGRWKEGGK